MGAVLKPELPKFADARHMLCKIAVHGLSGPVVVGRSFYVTWYKQNAQYFARYGKWDDLCTLLSPEQNYLQDRCSIFPTEIATVKAEIVEDVLRKLGKLSVGSARKDVAILNKVGAIAKAFNDRGIVAEKDIDDLKRLEDLITLGEASGNDADSLEKWASDNKYSGICQSLLQCKEMKNLLAAQIT